MRVHCVVGGTEAAFERSLDHHKCTSIDICCGGAALYAGTNFSGNQEEQT